MALVMALGMIAVLTSASATLVSYPSSTARIASDSGTGEKAYAAEAGVSSAVVVLGLSTNDALDLCLLHPSTNSSGATCAGHAAGSVV